MAGGGSSRGADDPWCPPSSMILFSGSGSRDTIRKLSIRNTVHLNSPNRGIFSNLAGPAWFCRGSVARKANIMLIHADSIPKHRSAVTASNENWKMIYNYFEQCFPDPEQLLQYGSGSPGSCRSVCGPVHLVNLSKNADLLDIKL
jgi:hypothetical protein